MKRLLLSVLSVSVLSLVATAAPSKADLELARRQARSVHLQYATGVKNAASVQGTVTVTETQKNSYYCLSDGTAAIAEFRIRANTVASSFSAFGIPSIPSIGPPSPTT